MITDSLSFYSDDEVYGMFQEWGHYYDFIDRDIPSELPNIKWSFYDLNNELMRRERIKESLATIKRIDEDFSG